MAGAYLYKPESTQRRIASLSMAKLPPHLADMAMFSVMTGMRRANVKGLRWGDVDLRAKHLRIAGENGKNGHSQGFR